MNIFDHCKAVEDIMTAGIDCYISKQTAEAIGITGHRIKEITPRHRYSIGSWVAKAFKTEHDVPSFGFLLWSMETKEKLVYITDSMYSRYVFPKMDYIMVECNYSKKILDRNVTAGKIHPGQKNRIIQTHFGLENVKDFLRANDLSRVKEIHLLHLSDRNSSANCFKKAIQSLTGKPVYVAG
jgi:phosphoribosyl 1,2-cyclic phosphodiesterase